MARYKILFSGEFIGPLPRKSDASSPSYFENDLAGFYTTRVVRAHNESDAIIKAESHIAEELNELLEINETQYKIFACRIEVISWYEGFPSKGFTFFTDKS